jgi:hypothetical protein
MFGFWMTMSPKLGLLTFPGGRDSWISFQNAIQQMGINNFCLNLPLTKGNLHNYFAY